MAFWDCGLALLPTQYQGKYKPHFFACISEKWQCWSSGPSHSWPCLAEICCNTQLSAPASCPATKPHSSARGCYWHRSIGTTTMSKYRLASSASSSSHPVVKMCLRIRRCCHWWEGIFCITTRMTVMLCLERETAGHQKGQCKIQSCLVQMLGSTQISSDCC